MVVSMATHILDLKNSRFPVVELCNADSKVMIADGDHLVQFLWDRCHSPFDAVCGGNIPAFLQAAQIFLDVLVQTCRFDYVDIVFGGFTPSRLSGCDRSASAFVSLCASIIGKREPRLPVHFNPQPCFAVSLLISLCQQRPDAHKLRLFYAEGGSSRLAAQRCKTECAYAVLSDDTDLVLLNAPLIRFCTLRCAKLEEMFGNSDSDLLPPGLIRHSDAADYEGPGIRGALVLRGRLMLPDAFCRLVNLNSPSLLPLWASLQHNDFLGGDTGREDSLGMVHARIRDFAPQHTAISIATGELLQHLSLQYAATVDGVIAWAFPHFDHQRRLMDKSNETQDQADPLSAARVLFAEKFRSAYSYYTHIPSFRSLSGTKGDAVTMMLLAQKIVLCPALPQASAPNWFPFERLLPIRGRLYAMWEFSLLQHFSVPAPLAVTEYRQGALSFEGHTVDADVQQTAYRAEIDSVIRAVTDGQTPTLTAHDQAMLVLFGMSDNLFLRMRSSVELENMLLTAMPNAGSRKSQLEQCALILVALCALSGILAVEECICISVFFASSVRRLLLHNEATDGTSLPCVSRWQDEDIVSLESRHFQTSSVVQSVIWHVQLVNHSFGNPFGTVLHEFLSSLSFSLLVRILAAHSGGRRLLDLGIAEVDGCNDAVTGLQWFFNLEKSFYKEISTPVFPIPDSLEVQRRRTTAPPQSVIRGRSSAPHCSSRGSTRRLGANARTSTGTEGQTAGVEPLHSSAVRSTFRATSRPIRRSFYSGSSPGTRGSYNARSATRGARGGWRTSRS
eukprot:ANDGO_03780.mRNA.1 hypothetical protein